MRFLLIGVFALLSALELAMLTMPLGPLIFTSKGPKDEFSGIAMFGSIIIVSGLTAIIGLIGAAAFAVIKWRDDTDRKFKRVTMAIAIAVATWIFGLFIFMKAEAGIAWAMGFSMLALLIGIPTALRRPYNPDARWGEK